VKVVVMIKRRADIADPQGSTVAGALRALGYENVSEVRIDKAITITLPDSHPQAAVAQVREMCEKLLANPVLEDFEVVVER